MDQTGQFLGHKDSVNCVVFNHYDGATLASGSDDSTCRIWDTRTNKAVQCMMGFFHGEAVTAVDFGTAKDHLVYAAAGNCIYSFDLRKKDIIVKSSEDLYDFNTDEINQLVRHPRKNSPFLAAADDAGEIKIIDLDRNTIHKTLRPENSNICSSVQFRPNSAWHMVSGDFNSALTFWDFSRSSAKKRINLTSTEAQGSNATSRSNAQLVNPPFVHSISFSPKGHSFVAGCGDGSVAVVDFSLFQVKHRLHAHQATVSQVHFPSFDNGNRFISVGNDYKIKWWDYKQLEKNSQELEAHHYNIGSFDHPHKANSVASSPSEKSLFFADTSRIIAKYTIL